MDQNKNTKQIWNIVIIIAIVLIAGLLIRGNKSNNSPEDGNIVAGEVEGTEDTTPVTVAPGAGVSATPSAASLSYAQALAKYKDTRIQLGTDASCNATPNNMTFKNGTTVMIDNRSPKDRTVKLGATYNIKGYGFRIVTLSSSTLPATWLMDCGAQQNVATILLQK